MRTSILLLVAAFLTSACTMNSANDKTLAEKLDGLNVYTFTNKKEYIPLYDQGVRVTIKNDSPFRVYLDPESFIMVQRFENGNWVNGTPSGFNEHWFETNGLAKNFVLDVGEPITLGLLDIKKILDNQKGNYRFKLDYCLEPYTKSGSCSAPVPDEYLTSNSFSVLDVPADLSSIDARFDNLNLEFVTEGDTFQAGEDIYVPLSVINRSPFSVFLQRNRPFVIFQRLVDGEWIDGLNGDEKQAAWSFRLEQAEYYILSNGEEVIVRPLNVDNHLVQTAGTYRFKFRICLRTWDEDLCEANVPEPYSVSDPFFVVN